MGVAQARERVKDIYIKTTGWIAGRFRHAASTRKGRLGLATAGACLIIIVSNYGYFLAELGYQTRHVAADREVFIEPTDIEAEPVVEPLGPDQIRISSVDIIAPIVYGERINEAHFQEKLRHGVVHYPLTAELGEPGNAFLFGHSSDFAWRDSPYRHVFATLPHVVIGDMIEVTDADGVLYRYQVEETFVVTPKDTRVLDQGDRTESILTLQTSYPLGTALARFIVRARLVIESP